MTEKSIDYQAIYARGGENHGDEDFAFFKCPNCDHVYLLEGEVDTVYLDGKDLTSRKPVFNNSFDCIRCEVRVPDNVPWVGPKASNEFRVTEKQLADSDWSWAWKQLNQFLE